MSNKMKTQLYKIRALTNMHVGNGDINFGVVDNMVQRDVITSYPIINGSSLKGALRDHFKNKQDVDGKVMDYIFGTESLDENNDTGSYKFFEARLLAYPVRSMQAPYFLATCPLIIREVCEYAELMMCDFKEQLQEVKKYINEEIKINEGLLLSKKKNNDKIEIEELSIEVQEAKDSIVECFMKLFGCDEIVVLADEVFQSLVSENLPVIARNKLENRISKNLWYEEIVPRESLFYTALCQMDNGKESLAELDYMKKQLEKDVVQIGANASIGYGYTKFEQLKGC